MSHKSYNKAAVGIILDAQAGKAELQPFEKGNNIEKLQMKSQQDS